MRWTSISWNVIYVSINAFKKNKDLHFWLRMQFETQLSHSIMMKIQPQASYPEV